MPDPKEHAMIDPLAAERHVFWSDVFRTSGTSTPRFLLHIFLFGAIAAGWCYLDSVLHPNLGVEVTLMELAGAAIGLLLVLRTNEGYGRWWESRKLWGGIVNQSRNLVIQALAHGPEDDEWRDSITRWSALFIHACRRSLRGERDVPEAIALVGEAEAAAMSRAGHFPSYVSLRIAKLIEIGGRAGMINGAVIGLERERCLLIDHYGGCERILKTPLPWVYVVHLRRFIAAYLVTLPLGLIAKVGWLPTPLLTMMVAYPILALDRIAVELQNPFATKSLNHLPLDQLCEGLEKNLLGLRELDAEELRLAAQGVGS